MCNYPDVVVVGLLASIGQWGLHYTPWRRFFGRELPRVGAYTLGTVCWMLAYAAGVGVACRIGVVSVVRVNVLLAISVACSGVSVGGAYLLDWALSNRDRADVNQEVVELLEVER